MKLFRCCREQLHLFWKNLDRHPTKLPDMEAADTIGAGAPIQSICGVAYLSAHITLSAYESSLLAGCQELDIYHYVVILPVLLQPSIVQTSSRP